MRRILTVLVLATGLLAVWHPATVSACSCQMLTEAEAVERADMVFTGTVTESLDVNAGAAVRASDDPIEWTFAIDAVLKGPEATQRVVTSAMDGASCGASYLVGERYLVHATAAGQDLRTGSCGGDRILPTLATAERPPASAQPNVPGTPGLPFATGAALVLTGAALAVVAQAALRRRR